MADYLLDTNHASRLMALDEPITSLVSQAWGQGHRFGISVSVLGELYFAVYASKRQAENMERLHRLIDALLLWPFDAESAEEYGRIQAEQRAKGRPIPSLDAQIAAVARRYGLVVLTADRHFSWVDGLIAENWLAQNLD